MPYFVCRSFFGLTIFLAFLFGFFHPSLWPGFLENTVWTLVWEGGSDPTKRLSDEVAPRTAAHPTHSVLLTRGPIHPPLTVWSVQRDPGSSCENILKWSDLHCLQYTIDAMHPLAWVSTVWTLHDKLRGCDAASQVMILWFPGPWIRTVSTEFGQTTQNEDLYTGQLRRNASFRCRGYGDDWWWMR